MFYVFFCLSGPFLTGNAAARSSPKSQLPIRVYTILTILPSNNIHCIATGKKNKHENIYVYTKNMLNPQYQLLQPHNCFSSNQKKRISNNSCLHPLIIPSLSPTAPFVMDNTTTNPLKITQQMPPKCMRKRRCFQYFPPFSAHSLLEVIRIPDCHGGHRKKAG